MSHVPPPSAAAEDILIWTSQNFTTRVSGLHAPLASALVLVSLIFCHVFVVIQEVVS